MPFIFVNENPTILSTAAAFKHTPVSAVIYFLIILGEWSYCFLNSCFKGGVQKNETSASEQGEQVT